MNFARLAKWYGRLPLPQVEKLSLFYVGVQGEEPVRNWRPREMPQGASERQLLEEILEVAQEDCNEREFASRYLLRALGEADAELQSLVMKNKPDGSTDPEYGDPSGSGIVAQCLRHNEAFARMIIGSMRGVLDAQTQIISMQSEQIKALRQAAQAREEATGDDPESIAKAEALIKLSDAVSEHVIPIAARWMDATGPGIPGVEPPTG
ncbi:MAG: hypothetical protein GWO24_19190 [Akkermansiaceae bacterium]|nr:hypothetical protein [Akkermansiaceae bacterium]